MPQVVTLGEPLIQLNAVTIGPLRHVIYFERHVAGSEANFAVGVKRMGLTSGLIARVGSDEFGKCILATLRGEGVDVSQIRIDDSAPTGVYFIQRGYPTPGKSVMFYYRTASAASRLSPEDIKPSFIKGATLLHLTGITPAISSSCRDAWEKAAELAHHSNAKISLETNIRPKLWSSVEARNTLLPIIPKVDIVLTDPDDSNILVGQKDPNRAAKKLMEKGPSLVVFKLGSAGSIAFSGRTVIKHGAYEVPVVDPIGAGDAFAAAFVSGILKGWRIKKSLEAGSVAGSLVTTTRGDNENTPSPPDIESFLAGVKGPERKIGE